MPGGSDDRSKSKIHAFVQGTAERGVSVQIPENRNGKNDEDNEGQNQSHDFGDFPVKMGSQGIGQNRPKNRNGNQPEGISSQKVGQGRDEPGDFVGVVQPAEKVKHKNAQADDDELNKSEAARHTMVQDLKLIDGQSKASATETSGVRNFVMVFSDQRCFVWLRIPNSWTVSVTLRSAFSSSSF